MLWQSTIFSVYFIFVEIDHSKLRSANDFQAAQHVCALMAAIAQSVDQ